jgi:hypothetical protein
MVVSAPRSDSLEAESAAALPVPNPLRNNARASDFRKLRDGKTLLSSSPFRSPSNPKQPATKLTAAS